MTYWLIEHDTWLAMTQARNTGLTPTSDQCEAFAARAIQDVDPRQAVRGLRVSGETAEISVQGSLTRSPDLFAMLFGGGNTSYSAIRAALAKADADPGVREIVLKIDSPGGEVAGLFETVDAIRAVSKPVTAKVSSALSAAYAIASAASSIEATGPGSSFGSVGVVASYYVDDKIKEITSTHASDKRPDPTTAEGQGVIREYLDEIHQLFAQSIADGRGKSVEMVNAEFGKGRVFLAAESVKRGMADKINKPALKAVSQNPNAKNSEGKNSMKFSEYRAAHPDEAAQAVNEGVTQERERVQAHLTMGEQCGDLAIAIEAVNAGIAFGHAPTQARYMSAAINRKDVSSRATDDVAVVEASANAKVLEADGDMGDKLEALYLSEIK